VAHGDASHIDPYTYIVLEGNVESLFLGYLLIGTSSTKKLQKIFYINSKINHKARYKN
jgi:D-serine dehydratase